MWGPKPPPGAKPGSGAAPSRGRSSGSGGSSSSTPTQPQGQSHKPPVAPKPPVPKPAQGAGATAGKQSVASAAAAKQPQAETTPHPAQPGPQQQQQPRMVNCAVSLKFLIDFCGTVPEDMPTWKVVTDVIVPATRSRQCRYVEMIEPRHVGPCDYFISHRWATPFSHLVRYVRKHLVELGDVAEEAGDAAAEGRGSAGAAPAGVLVTRAGSKGAKADYDEEVEPKRSADKVFVWCDIFAINQHPGQVQADDLAQLKDCVEASQQTLLCLDNQGLVLTRIWCLYEIWNTVLAGGPPKLAVLGYDVDIEAFKEVYITLDVEEAQATVDSDRVRILKDIAASTGLQELNLVLKGALVGSTQAEAENALSVLLPRCKVWKDYERVMTAVSKHTQMLATVGRHQESQRYGYVIQSVSSEMQKCIAQQDAKAAGPKRASAPGAGTAPADAAPAAAAAAAGDLHSAAAAVPDWHWSMYPRDSGLRQMFDRAASAEKHGRFDTATALQRDAVSKAEQRLKEATGDAAKSAAALDLAGCRLRMAALLVARGFLDQALVDAGEPAVAAFEELAGPRSLTFASAGLRVAQLAKNNWQKTDLRTRLLDSAYGIFESKLGLTHETTLDALAEKAELTFSSGDFPAGIELFHKLAVRLSEGTDLSARPPSSASAAAAAAAATAILELSPKAVEVWQKLMNYMTSASGFEEECIRICKALIPQKRREHIRRLQAAAADPASEYQNDAAVELRRLGLSRAVSSRPSSTASSASAAARRVSAAGVAGVGSAALPSVVVDLEPDGLTDPDDPRVDVANHSTELHTWSMMLAKQGKMTEAVLLQWRVAEINRGNKVTATMEMQLPTGKVSLVAAYEHCLILDMSVPGVAKVAAKMMAERDGTSAATPDTAAAATADKGSAAASAGAAAAKPAAYDGPGYMELVQEMGKKWGELDFKAAEPLARKLVECQVAGHGAASKEVVDAKSQLARLLVSAGKHEEAVAEMREAVALHEQLRHGKDPDMASTLQTLADMVGEKDREEGEKLHRRAVDLLTKVHGPDHFQTAQAVMLLAGFIMSNSSRIEEGQALMAKGQAVMTKFQEQQASMMRAF